MNSKQRRHFTSEQKLAIVKRHLVDKVPVSDICDEHQILATQFYQWQKQLFENGASAFEQKGQAAEAVQRRAASAREAPADSSRGLQRVHPHHRFGARSYYPRATVRSNAGTARLAQAGMSSAECSLVRQGGS